MQKNIPSCIKSKNKTEKVRAQGRNMLSKRSVLCVLRETGSWAQCLDSRWPVAQWQLHIKKQRKPAGFKRPRVLTDVMPASRRCTSKPNHSRGHGLQSPCQCARLPCQRCQIKSPFEQRKVQVEETEFVFAISLRLHLKQWLKRQPQTL